MNDKTYILYGAEPSYYTGKVRCYLRKKNIPFEERVAGHPGFGDATKKAGSTKIPILVAPDGTVVQDTTDIIDYLEPLFPGNPAYPSSPNQKLVALLMEVFGDECMLKPAMHYRWNFPDDNFPYIFGSLAERFRRKHRWMNPPSSPRTSQRACSPIYPNWE